jgi:site-specific DNA-methyltransferase (adenine-specific)
MGKFFSPNALARRTIVYSLMLKHKSTQQIKDSAPPRSLYAALGLHGATTKRIATFAKQAGVPVSALQYYEENHKLPLGTHLSGICEAAGLSEPALMLRLGVLNQSLIELLRGRADAIAALLPKNEKSGRRKAPSVAFRTEYGRLHRGDCLDLLASMDDESIDLVFADPPFNLKKLYPSGIDDDLRERTYRAWCEEWLAECLRVLRPGGSLFVWNLPRWNAVLSQFLAERATFRHWIASDLKVSLPIAGRLYPSHYALLYFCKGEKPRVFHPDRLPMEICPHCLEDLRDYGGYKDKMNPTGVNLTDVWYDIPPVRHSKHKKRSGANELSVRLLDRIIEMASDEGDVVFDPFGGAGTTYAVAEIKRRRWIGVEIGPIDDIVSRLSNLKEESAHLGHIRQGYNHLFVPEIGEERERRGLWTDRTVRSERLDHAEPPTDSTDQQELPLEP